MSLFKRKPDLQAMAYIICESSLQRIEAFSEQSEEIVYYGYVVSSYIILDILPLEYSEEVISKCKQYSHEFFIKKFKQFKDKDTQAIYDLFNSYDLVMKTNDMAEYFLQQTHCLMSLEEIDSLFREWYRMRLLIREEKTEY